MLKHTSYLAAFWCPLEIKDGSDNIIWKNPVPNSILFCRPVDLLRGKENNVTVEKYFKPTLDRIKGHKNTPLQSGDLQIFNRTEVSMVDGKMAAILDGTGGGFCHYCHASRKDANSIVDIHLGFRITRTIEEALEIWRKLETGELKYTDPERKGQTNKCLLGVDLRYFGVLHSELRSLDHTQKILYHLVAKEYQWSERAPGTKAALAEAKEKVIRHVRDNTQMMIDTPTSSGGNTNTGPLAKEWFSPKFREAICSVVEDPVDHENFRELLSKFNILCTVVQQVDYNVNPDKVRDLGYELMVFHKEMFPWAMISPSVHTMCAHYWELFEMNNCSPIAAYSEQSGEHWNKHIRNIKSGAGCRAQQSSIQVNTRDIFVRISNRSHPNIALKRRMLKCSVCGLLGHTARSCKSTIQECVTLERTKIEECYIK